MSLMKIKLIIMNQTDFWELIGFIKVSPARLNCILCIGKDYKMPTEIAKESGMTVSQISNALNDLKKKGIIFCLNDKAIKGRLYQNTEIGLELLKEFESKNNKNNR